MPLAFLFYEHGFEPRWGGCEAEETYRVFQRSPQEALKPVETHGLPRRGLQRMRPRSKRGPVRPPACKWMRFFVLTS